MVFLGDDFYEFLYSALSLVRKWIHALRQFTVLVKHLTYFQGVSPCSALSLVRQRIHAVRQSTRLFWKNFTRFLREGRRRPFRSAEADPHGPAF